MQYRNVGAAALFFAIMTTSFSSGAQPVDEEAARSLARESECLQCHAVDKTKKGPSYKKIAAKFKGKPDAEEKIYKHITSGQKVKLEDGTEEDHRIVKSKDMGEIKNLINWILSQ